MKDIKLMKKLTDRKPKVLIIFADLDGTVTPLDAEMMLKFAKLTQKIQEKENIAVKFCPVTGRSGDYVLSFMHMMRTTFNKAGLKDVFEFGAGEQGAVVVDVNRSYYQKYLGDDKKPLIKPIVQEIIQKSPYRNFLVDEQGKRFTSSVHIKKELKQNLPLEEQKKMYTAIRDSLVERLGNSVDISMSHNCMEVMHKEISKANAIRYLANQYLRNYEIVGMTYSGDAENDKVAINYVSRLAEIPGIRANVFLPGNANSCIESQNLEQWKNKNRHASTNRILKSDKAGFEGVLELLATSLEKGTLVSKGISKWETKDDMAMSSLA